MNVKEFCEHNKIKAEVEYADSNPFMNDDKWQANHYKVTLKMGRKQFTTYYSMGMLLTDEPTAHDVLDSVASDSRSVEDVPFEDFCDEFGYDTDSRKAEHTYNVCVSQAKKLHKFLGYDLYRTLLDEVEGL